MGRSFKRNAGCICKAMPIWGHFVSHRFYQHKDKNPYHLITIFEKGPSIRLAQPFEPIKPAKSRCKAFS
jgi:hypothetical protein